MSIEVIVPFSYGCAHRERALAWVLSRYQWPVTVAEAPPGPWVKALAVMAAVESCASETVVVADADVWTDGLPEAVRAVEEGAQWAIPHRLVHRLTEEGTEAVLRGEDWREQPLEQSPYPGLEGGGFVVARRETLLEVPLDPRFVGWGQEDAAWGVALTALLGSPWRGEAPLIHLWHPHPKRLTRTRGSKESWDLRRRYMQARHDPDAMRSLIEEGRRALDAAEPRLHHHPPLIVR